MKRARAKYQQLRGGLKLKLGLVRATYQRLKTNWRLDKLWDNVRRDRARARARARAN